MSQSIVLQQERYHMFFIQITAYKAEATERNRLQVTSAPGTCQPSP